MNADSHLSPHEAPRSPLWKKLLPLLLILCCCFFQSCASPGKQTSYTQVASTDDRSFDGRAERFERPPPFGSRFNDDE